MAIERKVIDLATVRRARMAKFCAHRHAELDANARVLQCSDCGAHLDPIDHLDRLASEAEWIAMLGQERRDVAKAIEAEKVTLAKLRAGVKRAAESDATVRTLRDLKRRVAERLRSHPDEAVQRMRAELRETIDSLLSEAIAALAGGVPAAEREGET